MTSRHYSITWIEPVGQWTSHPLQTKQSSTLTWNDFRFLISYTPTGQVFTQVSHPEQVSLLTIILTNFQFPSDFSRCLGATNIRLCKLYPVATSNFVDLTSKDF